MFNLEYIDVTKEKETMKGEIVILGRKLKELNLEMKLQNEELQRVNREKTAVDSEKNESEKLLIQEKAKVGNLENELVKLKRELQSKNVLLDESKQSMTLKNYLYSKFKFECDFQIFYTYLHLLPSFQVN